MRPSEEPLYARRGPQTIPQPTPLGIQRPPQAYAPELAPIQPPPPSKEYVYVLPSDIGVLPGVGSHVYMVSTLEYERYKGIPTVPAFERRTGPQPWSSEWLIGAITEFDPWKVGGELAESITGKKMTKEQKALHTRVGIAFMEGPKIKNVYGKEFGISAYRQLKEFAYVPVGAYQVVESFWRPTTPTLVGATVSYALTGGKPEVYGPEFEKIEEHPGLLLGEILGEYFTAKAFAWGVGKTWKGVKYFTPQRIKEPLSQWWRFGTPAKIAYQTKVWRIEHLPTWKGSRIQIWLAKGTAKGKIEESIFWGEEKFFLPGEFEVSESMQKIYKFTGFPVIYGKKATYEVIQVARPTAFDQIAKAVERGMFPKMGTLSASQTLVTKKAIPEAFTGEIAFSKTAFTVSKKASQRIVPILLPRIYQPSRKKEKAIVTPKMIQVPFELERLKFKPLEVVAPKTKEREKAFPALRLLAETKQVQLPKQITVPDIPSPTIPETVTPTIPPFLPPWGGGGDSKRGKDLFGKWFKREHRIKTPSEMMKTYIGVDLTRRGK